MAAAVASARAAEPACGRDGAQAEEVLVVDGGSADATVARACSGGARVCVAAPGRARQLAAGVAATRAEALLFLHADSVLPAGFARAVRETLADESVSVGAFTLRFDAPRGCALALVEWGVRVRCALLRLPFGDQALFMRRAALAAVGGVPQVAVMEDVDLVRALRRRGRVVVRAEKVCTSARRYRARGVARTVLRNALALCARALGVSRERIARWVRS